MSIGFVFRSLVLTICACGMVVSAHAIQTASERASALVAAVQDTGVLEKEVGDIPAVLSMLTAGTRFADRVNVNKPVKESALNVYLLAHHLSDRENVSEVIFQSKILGNCAFVGVSNAIICDSEFVDRFLIDHGVFNEVPNDSLERAKRDYQYAFLAWVLGHELGHVIAGGPAAHFGQANTLDSEQQAGIELAQGAETAADLFAAKKIEADRRLTVALEGMLVALIDQEVAEKNGKSPAYGVGLHWDYANRRVIQYFANQDHPEFVIRATRILTFLASDMHEETLKALMATFTRHLIQVNTERE